MSDQDRAEARIDQIFSAIKEKDNEALKSLFSKKVLDEADDFDGEVDVLFDFMQGDIVSLEWDGSSPSEASMGGGKQTLMIQFGFTIKTNQENYHFFVIDYNEDTKNPDNQGVYMLELIENYGERELETWQDRMRPGIYIH